MVTVESHNAKSRLNVLHRLNILDSEAEEEYDEITGMAAFICHTPIAFISFIDDERQWLKSKVDFDLENIPIDISLCSYAIKDPRRIMVVPDATKDERFKDNPLTQTDPPVIFCASLPLLYDGVAIGTLCVIDHVPRKINHEQRKALRFLAKCVTDKLEQRKNQTHSNRLQLELEGEIDLLYKAINSSSDHFFVIDPETMTFINFNETAVRELGYTRKELFNLAPHEIKPLFTKELLQKKYLELIHSPNKSAVIQTLHRKKNGELIDVEIHFSSIRHNNRDIIISSARNVTDKINNEKRLSESEEKYRNLFNSLPDIVFRSDGTGKITMINPACFDILEYMASELINKPATIIYEDPEETEKVIDEIKRKKVINNYRLKLRCKSGEIKTVSLNARGIYKNGNFAGIEGIVSDITGVIKYEEALISTKDFYETILNSITEDIAVFNEEGKYIFLNTHAIKDENLRNWLIGKTDLDYCIEKGKPVKLAEERFEKHMLVNDTGKRVDWMEELTGKDGNPKYISRHLEPFIDKDGKNYKVGFGLDVTNLKNAEKNLAEGKKYLRSLFNAIPDLIFRIDKNGRYLDYKADNKNLLAIDPEIFLGKTMHEIFPKEVADFHMAHVQKALQKGEVITYEYEMRVRSGEVKYFEARINTKGEDEVVIIARDITERRLNEQRLITFTQQLKEREENIRQLITSAPDSIVVCDAESKILLWNPKSEELFGWKESEIIGKTLTETIIPSRYREAHARGIKYSLAGNGGSMINNTVETTGLNKNGNEFYISITISKSVQAGHPVFIAFMRDISLIKQNQIAIQKNEKQLNDAQQIAKVGSYERNIKTNRMVCSREFFDIIGIERNNDNVINVDDYFKLVHPDDLQRVMSRRDELNESDRVPPIDYRIITPAGELKYITSRTTEMKGLQKHRHIIFGTIQDITERVMFDKKLYQAVIESEEKERKRIAGELHDGVQQYLAAAKLSIETARNMIPAGHQQVHYLMENSKNLLLNSLNITRKVSHDLMPADLYEEGFCKAVKELISNLNTIDTIKYEAHIHCEIKEPEPIVSVNLFRIIQEFIRNSQKYAAAKNIIVEINYIDNHLELYITDDGKGYVMNERNKNGIGILNMIKRIETIGGTYTYETAPGKGVKLMIKVPL